MIDIVASMQRETWHWRFLPWSVNALFSIPDSQRIIVDNHLMLLPVTFTWSKYIGTCILEHGNKIGVDDGLCEQVFACCE